MPFLSPDTARKTAWNITRLDNRTLRIIGLFSMLAGVGILHFLNG
ncbi:DUF2065 domain-containing protein [Oceanicoccus sp. KOV_DT_Chl]|nr:DUF2065 domain-containing protein [Oceanicoccus sp. KOV_DT_Chl]